VLIALLALAGQAVNLYLNLKIRAALLESEKRVMEAVHRDYLPREVFAAVCRHPAKDC
jgi:hypothetical protein